LELGSIENAMSGILDLIKKGGVPRELLELFNSTKIKNLFIEESKIFQKKLAVFNFSHGNR